MDTSQNPRHPLAVSRITQMQIEPVVVGMPGQAVAMFCQTSSQNPSEYLYLSKGSAHTLLGSNLLVMIWQSNGAKEIEQESWKFPR